MEKKHLVIGAYLGLLFFSLLALNATQLYVQWKDKIEPGKERIHKEEMELNELSSTRLALFYNKDINQEDREKSLAQLDKKISKKQQRIDLKIKQYFGENPTRNSWTLLLFTWALVGVFLVVILSMNGQKKDLKQVGSSNIQLIEALVFALAFFGFYNACFGGITIEFLFNLVFGYPTPYCSFFTQNLYIYLGIIVVTIVLSIVYKIQSHRADLLLFQLHYVFTLGIPSLIVWFISELDTSVSGSQDYFCTIAAHGSPWLVGKTQAGTRIGERIKVSKQLQICNAFEELLSERSPKTHRVIRQIYDALQIPVHRWKHKKLIANGLFILLKPIEWFSWLYLQCFESHPKKRINRQYLDRV